MDEQEFTEIGKIDDSYLYEDYVTSRYEDFPKTTYPSGLDSLEPRDEPISPNSISKRIRSKAKKSKNEIRALSSFKKDLKAPKKEYIRCKLIRGHKRAIRQAIKKIHPTKTIHRVDELSEVEHKSWTKFCLHVLDNKAELIEKSKTENGPKTDGASKRKQNIVSLESQKSFNDDFCREYFSDNLTIESFGLYVDIIFANLDPENLIARFEFNCCDKKNITHTIECDIKWEILKKYLQLDMISDLGIMQPNTCEVAESDTDNFLEGI
jgi:hypothetical protein